MRESINPSRLRTISRAAAEIGFAGAAVRRRSAMSIWSSTDLLSQPLAMSNYRLRYWPSVECAINWPFMRLQLSLSAFCCLALSAQMRPPAVPLVTHDPYFSIWSMADQLNADGTRHWTGKPGSLTAFARIDGKTYRIMGRERQQTAALPQTRLTVLPTHTIYEFAGGGVR